MNKNRMRRVTVGLAALLSLTAMSTGVVDAFGSGSNTGGGCGWNYASWQNYGSGTHAHRFHVTAWTQKHSSTNCTQVAARAKWSGGTAAWTYSPTLATSIKWDITPWTGIGGSHMARASNGTWYGHES